MKNTNLVKLKVLSILLIIMNVSFYIGALIILIGEIQDGKDVPTLLTYGLCFLTVYSCLFGLVHWVFVMNYFYIALSISDSKHKDSVWVHGVYYSIAFFQVLFPIIQTAADIAAYNLTEKRELFINISYAC